MKKLRMTGKYIGLFCLLVFMLGGCKEKEEATETLWDYRTEVVAVYSGQNVGSGVIYQKEDDSILLLTAAHVIDDAQETKVLLFDGTFVTATKVNILEIGDLATMEISLDACSPAQKQALAQADVAQVSKAYYDDASAQDIVIIIGITEKSLTSFSGILRYDWVYTEDYQQYMMIAQLKGATAAEYPEGMSGGVLLDAQGYLLGILSGISEDGMLAVVPLALLGEF